MPQIKVQEPRLIERIADVFKKHGYEGASLSRLSHATGLQRASLYHRFPRGKEEMAEVIFDHSVGWLVDNALTPLLGNDPPAERVRRMIDRLREFYDDGRGSCLLDTMSLGASANPFSERVRDAISAWQDAMARTARDSGVLSEDAHRRAEEALVQIQGSLVLARGSGKPEVFQRALDRLLGILAPDPATR